MAKTNADITQKIRKAMHSKIVQEHNLEHFIPSSYQRTYINQRKRQFFRQNIDNNEKENSVLHRIRRKQEKQDLYEKVKINMSKISEQDGKKD